MLSRRILHSPICTSCRLRASIVAKQLARSKKPLFLQQWRSLSTNQKLLRSYATHLDGNYWSLHAEVLSSPEEVVLQARKSFGDSLPDDVLNEEQYKVYERLYGEPLEYVEQQYGLEEDGEVALEDEAGTGVLKETEDGALEEVEFATEEVVEDEDGAEMVNDGEVGSSAADERLAEDIQASLASEAVENTEQEDGDDSFTRSHPLTLAYRFGTSPSALPLPTHSLVDPIQAQLSSIPNKHIREAAHRVFGGVGLPYSTSTPAVGKTLQQKPIGLDASQSKMRDIEGDVFMASLVPGIYAAAMSVLVETRKRLGTAWAESLVEKAKMNELRILDAGGGGAGVLAIREMLRAEWERMHEESQALNSSMSLAEADGKVGGAGLYPPLGNATVLTGSDALRRRTSRLLENTTFVPRLPDYLHTEDAKKKGKFDIIVAPHTLWPLREDHLRKTHLQNLWDLLSQDGGVLLLLEKGVARGFELVAGAREMLLESRITSTNPDLAPHVDSPLEREGESSPQNPHKETGMIIAPCTNHESCPMYQPRGMLKGRRDICHFSQRYIRPPFLQNILGARDKNFEDVKFSYLSIMRGRDLRVEKGIQQNETATDLAFEGYEHHPVEEDNMYSNGLNQPRTILPPLKRRGHVILDLCTPSGTLERWTVPKSFSKQAFRDARKSNWGDLWPLGAKTRVPRTPKIKKRKSIADMDVQATKVRKGGEWKWDVDAYGRLVGGGATQSPVPVPAEKGEGGRLRSGRKVKGVRDKRDRKVGGNGRRKNDLEE